MEMGLVLGSSRRTAEDCLVALQKAYAGDDEVPFQSLNYSKNSTAFYPPKTLKTILFICINIKIINNVTQSSPIWLIYKNTLYSFE